MDNGSSDEDGMNVVHIEEIEELLKTKKSIKLTKCRIIGDLNQTTLNLNFSHE